MNDPLTIMRPAVAWVERARQPGRRTLAHLLRRYLLSRARGVTRGELLVDDAGDRFVVGSRTPDHPDSATLRVVDRRFYPWVALRGPIGFGEAYCRGWWESDDVVNLVRFFVRNKELLRRLDSGASLLTRPAYRLKHRLRRNTPSGSRRNIAAHYDLGNEFYELFLDETLSYSAGIFEDAQTSLRDASLAKNDRLCRNLDLQPGQRLLEIGCGWGSLALHAAQAYGAHVTAITISKKQRRETQRRVFAAGLSERVQVLLCDYRELSGRFDKIVSVEMIEAVGHEYYQQFFGKVADLLAADGLAALQTITIADQHYEERKDSVDFIKAHVFPGSCIPSVTALCAAATSGSDLRLVHLEDITLHYALTLEHWRRRFLDQVAAVRRLGHSSDFVRMWEFYLASCEAAFRERYIGDVQILMAKPGYRGRLPGRRPPG